MEQQNGNKTYESAVEMLEDIERQMPKNIEPEMYSLAWYNSIIPQNEQLLLNLRAQIEALTIQMHEVSGVVKVFTQLREIERQKEVSRDGNHNPY